MPRKPVIRYNPALSLKENADALGLSVSALKKHLQASESDFRYDSAYARWKTINDYKRSHPAQSLRKKSEELGYSVNTIRKYEAMSEEDLVVSFRDTEKLSQFDINNRNAIKTVSSNQSEILSGIMHLYNKDKPFDADLTASILRFYKSIPTPGHLYDKYPQRPEVKNLEETNNLPDGVFTSVVYDLPFIIKCGEQSVMREKFTDFESVEELYQANDEMLERAYRLLAPKGLLVVKTMDVNYSGKQYWVSDYVLRKAEDMGFTLLEKFILTSSQRLFPKTKNQYQARKYHAYFFVFRKQS